MKTAVESLDHFPSISQIAEIANNLRLHNPDWPGRTQSFSAITEVPYIPRTPWPAAIEGLLMGFDDPKGVSPAGLSRVGLTSEEARYLYDVAKKKDFDNEWALELIEKSNSKYVFKKGSAA